MKNENIQNVAVSMDDSKRIFRILLAHLGSGDIDTAKKVIINELEEAKVVDNSLARIEQKNLELVQQRLYQIHSLSTILDQIGFEYISLDENRYSNILGNFSELIKENTENAIDIIGEVL